MTQRIPAADLSALIRKSQLALFVVVALLSAFALRASASASEIPVNDKREASSVSRGRTQTHSIVIRELKHDTGQSLREIAPLLPAAGAPSEHEIENNVNPNHNWSSQVQKDPVLQTAETSPSSQTPNFSIEFDGAGNGDGICCSYIPPDNDGAVGTTQYVQYVNAEYLVFDKSGNKLLGPIAGNGFWTGFGGECESEDDGDPVIRFDAAAGRWVVSQMALGPSGTGPFFECVAVSQTDDATGSYYRYAFPMTYNPDYPKVSVWPDAYYFTFNSFPATGSGYIGANVCAADRSSMLAGNTATMQCFQQDSSHYGMLAADLDGGIAPSAGTPNFVMELDPNGSANLILYQFHIDWVTPANSTFTGPTLIPVATFTPVCFGDYRTQCIPQPTLGSGPLEALSDRLMWRLVYRNFGDHTTLLATHSIVATIGTNDTGNTAYVGTTSGIRWYEIRNPETSPAVFQSGTFAPDAQYRWMPAIAMDQSQDIAIGYSVSGASAGQYPSIAYAGRVPTDPAGTLEAEVVMVTGAGSQTIGNRWGDYSSLTIDPTDDCTFWYSEEYLKSNGSWNWSTAIGSFKFPGCGPSVPVISWTPSSITYGTTLSGVLNAAANSASIPVAGRFVYTARPTGKSASTVTAATVLSAGSYSLHAAFTPTNTVDFTSASGSVSFTVAKAAPTVVLAPTAATVLAKTAVTFTATVSSSASTPSGTVNFYDGTTRLGSPVTLAQGVARYTTSSLAAGSHSITAAYSGDGNFSTLTSSAITETVEDFALTVSSGSSSSQTVSPGGAADYTLQLAPTGGSKLLSAVALSVSGLPAGATATITPSTVSAGARTTKLSLSVRVPSQVASLNSGALLALLLSPFVAGAVLLFGTKTQRATRTLRLLLLILVAISVAGIVACGGISSLPEQNYTLTMKATSGSLSHSTTLNLTVTEAK